MLAKLSGLLQAPPSFLLVSVLQATKAGRDLGTRLAKPCKQEEWPAG